MSAKKESSVPQVTRAPSQRTRRSEFILEAAADLFRTRGYHGVGIDDVGARAGITGPGVYRHYPNKPSLLVELFDRVSGRLLVHGEWLIAEAASPREALERLIEFHVSFSLDERSLIAVYMQEHRNLPPEATRRFRLHQRRYVACWTEAIALLRPDLDADQASDTAHALIAMATSVSSHEPVTDRARLGPLMRDLCLRAVLGPVS